MCFTCDMRIQPVSILNYSNIYARKVDNKQNYYNFGYPADSVAFTSSGALTGKDFKKFSKYMTCLYTGEQMLASHTLEKMKTRGMFQGGIAEVVHKLEPYKKKYLTGIEKTVFERVEALSKTEPDLNLTEAMSKLADDIVPDFRNRQRPIIDAIKAEGKNLPYEYMEPFFKLMEITDRKIFDLPVTQKFSLKEFIYQANKNIAKLSDVNLKNRLSNSIKILSNDGFIDPATPLNSKIVKKVFNFINIKVPIKKGFYYSKHLKPYEKDKDAVIKKVIEDMRSVAFASGFKRFGRFCDDYLLRLQGKPVPVKFSNKALIYDLKKVLEGMPDTDLRDKMIAMASSLPNSSKSSSAFILKCRDLEPNVIGDRLFSPSLVSVEHLKPASEGGSDLMSNCALAKKSVNSLRQSEPLWITLTKYKQKNVQKYVNHLARLVNKKIIPYEDALAQVQTIEREGRIVLNKSELVKPEMAFMDVIKAELVKKRNSKKM